MKKLFLLVALVCAASLSSFAQQEGAYHFGDKENPDMVLAPGQPGYGEFAQAIAANSQENTENIDWEGVQADIASVPALGNYNDWLGSPRAAYGVWMYCCSRGGWSCYAHVPYSCSYACGSFCNGSPHNPSY